MSTPLRTAEIRWFWHKKKPLEQVFLSFEPGTHAHKEARTDHYLKTASKQTGVKIREGLHEIKAKYAPDKLLNFGKMEFWAKWSHSTATDLLHATQPALQDDWLPVSKSRQTFNIMPGGGTPVFVQDAADENCQVELTRVEFGASKKATFTLGLEASSKNGEEEHHLMAVIEAYKDCFQTLELLPSYGYPEFLAQKA